MSIVRVGLAETKRFAEGYDAIFGKKESKEKKEPSAESGKKKNKGTRKKK